MARTDDADYRLFVVYTLPSQPPVSTSSPSTTPKIPPLTRTTPATSGPSKTSSPSTGRTAINRISQPRVSILRKRRRRRVTFDENGDHSPRVRPDDRDLRYVGDAQRWQWTGATYRVESTTILDNIISRCRRELFDVS